MLGLLTGVVAWLRQPTSIAGIATLVGTATAVVSGDITVAHALPTLAAGAVALAIPESSGVPALVGQLIQAVENIPAPGTVTTTVVTSPAPLPEPPAPSTPPTPLKVVT
jgi:hypothetical protein